jgi:hypothetical protein
VKYLKTGSAYYAPSAAAVEMAESILKDKKKVLPCAALLEGEYGIHGLFVGVPVKLGARGIEQIFQVKLLPEEQAMLQKSAAAVQELVDVIRANMDSGVGRAPPALRPVHALLVRLCLPLAPAPPCPLRRRTSATPPATTTNWPTPPRSSPISRSSPRQRPHPSWRNSAAARKAGPCTSRSSPRRRI